MSLSSLRTNFPPYTSKSDSPSKRSRADLSSDSHSKMDNLSSHLGAFYVSDMTVASTGSKSGLAVVDENEDITSVVRVENSRDSMNQVNEENFYSENSLSFSKQQPEISPEDLRKMNDPKIRRIVNASQIYFLDFYFDLLTYIHDRQLRLQKFRKSVQNLPVIEQQEQWKSYTGRERAYLRKRRTKLRYGDFDILTQVGQGGYGQVYLARKSDTKEICALKVMKKRLLFKLDEIRHVLTERDILTAANSPWLVKLLYAFQDSESIYLAMEYVPGGDYRTLLNNTGVLSPRHARFYLSEMFCAIDSLHKLGYIHRDLKPENFLIDATGHIKLTDFGLSSGALSREKVESMRIKLDAVKDMRVPYRTVSERQNLYRSLREKDLNYANSIVGSPDYMALEVLEGKKYDFTIDYWSLGCMLFETLCGYPPFAGANMNETYSNLRSWRESLKRPVFEDTQYALSDRTWDFINRLISEPQNRLHSFKEIQRHPYFAEVDWQHIRQIQPPFIPQLDSEIDAGYFDDFSNQEDMAKYKEVHDKQAQLERLADRPEKIKRSAFVGFTFKHSMAPGILEDGSLNNNRRPVVNRQLDGSFATIF
ncbi:kinase-like domain-containing protein [Dipodascopsis uninucleata]